MKRKMEDGIKLIRYFCKIRPFIATPKSADLIKEKMRWHASNVVEIQKSWPEIHLREP